MKQEIVPLISTLINVLLSAAKLIVGLTINSVALIADGIHSGLDVFSSFIAFIGIKSSKKPIDEKHPYGYYKAESLAGLVVTITLAISGFWISYESISHFLKSEILIFSFWGIFIMTISIIINEVMARFKFYYGQKYESLSLVADAKHSRADVISSIGVLIGLIISQYLTYADAFIGLLIGLFILKESFNLSKEITDSLLDVSNKQLEEKIKKICQQENFEISQLKTRKIGKANFAELKIKLDPRLKLDIVNELTKKLESKLLNTIPELTYIVISVESHEVKQGTIISGFGQRMRYRHGIKSIGPRKKGQRTIIPLENNEISEHFGTKQYLIIDQNQKGKILQKKIIKNPYYDKEFGHGLKFVRAVSADRIIASHIGPNALKNIKALGLKLKIIKEKKTLKKLLKELNKK